MKSFDRYAELELISTDFHKSRVHLSAPVRIWQALGHCFRLGSLYQILFARLLNGSDPRILKRCDRQGNYYFEVYDPHNQERLNFSSEHEVRIWLDQRYNL